MKYYYDRYWGVFLSEASVGFVAKSDDIIGVGYSGQAAYINQQAFQDNPNLGCIPRGFYTISHTDEEKGPLTHHLEPASTNQMYGRAGFLIHGDNSNLNHTASEGCIVSPEWTRAKFKIGDVFNVLERSSMLWLTRAGRPVSGRRGFLT